MLNLIKIILMALYNIYRRGISGIKVSNKIKNMISMDFQKKNTRKHENTEHQKIMLNTKSQYGSFMNQ